MHIRNILVFIFIFFINLSAKSETNTVDCNQIFEERREELLNTINKIEEAKQSFKEFKDSANSLLNDREVSIDKKDKDVQALLSEIENRKENIKKMLDENKNMLGEIKKEKDDKITMTFAKMKASKAAPILEAMDVSKSSEIIFALDPKSMGKLLSKIEPSKASTIVNLIQKGPPFKEKEFFEYEKKQIENKISNRFKDYGDEDNIRKSPINRDKEEEPEQTQATTNIDDEKKIPTEDTTGIVDIATVD